MTVNETLGALGSWEIQLRDETPDYILDQLGFFGHVAIADGPVDVDAVGAGLLTGARYVGVLRAKDKDTGRTLSGSGMVFWLGDEDGKGHLLESELNLSGMTLAQAVAAIDAVCPPVTVGTVYSAAGVMPANSRFQFLSPREVLSQVCDAFNVEFRVNGNGTVDVGTAAQLYNTEAPDTIIVRKGAGTDMNLVALGGDYEVDESVYDYSTRVVLLGQTIGVGDEPDVIFATGSANAPSVPYLDLFGNPVKMVRPISESGTTAGSVAARAQLQLNRFNRVGRSLKVDADEYETEGNFVVGDNVYVYDPDTGIVNPANEVTFRGGVLHPDVVRVSGVTWPVVQGMTVAFRTQAGVWLDLTRFVTWETGGNELTVGDLPKSLSKPGDNPLQARIDAARSDASIPAAPTGLVLTTFSSLDARGRTVSTINADWNPAGLNTDGTVITDLSHYVFQYHWTGRASIWQQANVTDATDIDVIVTPSLPYAARVAAVDIAGNMSAWSSLASITSAADAVAPPAPADPVVTSYLGQLRIEYAGTDALGQPMPTDTNRIDVHVGTTSGFTASLATRVDSITPFAKGVSYATAPYSGTDNRWVRLIAVDHEGNASAASAAVGGHTVQAGDGDIAALSVGKLTAGTMSADVVMAGRFTTALTGARREMNAVGFQAYDASNALTINLDGVNNLLTGRFRTALTGRRIELGSSGGIGRIQFYAPDGTMSEIGSFTGAVPNTSEALRLSIPISGTSQLWNAFQMDSGQGLYAWTQYIKFTVGGNGSGGTKAFQVGFASTRGSTSDADIPELIRISIEPTHSSFWHPSDGSAFFADKAANGSTAMRFSIDPLDFNFYLKTGGYFRVRESLVDGSAPSRFSVGPGFSGEVLFQWPGTNARILFKSQAVSDASAGIFLFTNGNVGGRFNYAYNAGAEAFEFTDWQNTYYLRLRASAFDVVSDRATKNAIADYAGDSLAAIKAARLRTWRPKQEVKRSLPDGKQEAVAVDVLERLGFVADEAPAHWRVKGSGDLEAIDVMAVLADTVGAVAKLAGELDELRKAKK